MDRTRLCRQPRLRMLMLGFLAVTLSGCGPYHRKAIQTASMDHQCPPERITLVERTGITAILMVCGYRRVYRDVGSANTVVWMDVTETTRGTDPATSDVPEIPPQH